MLPSMYIPVAHDEVRVAERTGVFLVLVANRMNQTAVVVSDREMPGVLEVVPFSAIAPAKDKSN
jgi:hypothetical protein